MVHERTKTLRHDLGAIWTDGLAWSFMVGIAESSIPAFALAVGASNVIAGLSATVPMLIGALLQLASPRLVAACGSHRRWVVLCATIQAASFIPLVIAALLGAMPWPMLYIAAAIYWAAGLAAGPTWMAWVDQLVPPRTRIRYFARRTRFLHVLQILGLLTAGWILEIGERRGSLLVAFAVVFALAGIARAISAAILKRQSDIAAPPSRFARVSIRGFVERFRHGDDGRLIVYMLAVQFAQQFSGPFFAPYMLGELNFSYLEYMGLLGAAVFAKFACLPWHARLAERHGVRKLLWIGGLGIPLSVALWLVSTNYVYLFAAQVFAGATWSAYELATFLLFFEAIEPSERTSVLTTYNAASAVIFVLGSLCGGACLAALGSDSDAFLVLFGGSALLRLLSIPLLKRVQVRRAVRLSMPGSR